MNLVIANGPYFGSGMKAAPQAKTDDGLLDVVVIKKVTLLRQLQQFPRLYDGSYLKDGNIDTFCSVSIEISTKDETLAGIDADGDPVGFLPATFDILPGAIKFKI